MHKDYYFTIITLYFCQGNNLLAVFSAWPCNNDVYLVRCAPAYDCFVINVFASNVHASWQVAYETIPTKGKSTYFWWNITLQMHARIQSQSWVKVNYLGSTNVTLHLSLQHAHHSFRKIEGRLSFLTPLKRDLSDHPALLHHIVICEMKMSMYLNSLGTSHNVALRLLGSSHHVALCLFHSSQDIPLR